MLEIKHNFEKEKFKWLWSKYVVAGNDKYHCTNSLKGKYSKKFSKHNENFNDEKVIKFDEVEDFKAIYICGVANKGYSSKKNYPHNVHIAIIPKEGEKDRYSFDGWEVEITNGYVDRIPDIDELPEKYRFLEDKFITCRIFRWAIGYFFSENN